MIVKHYKDIEELKIDKKGVEGASIRWLIGKDTEAPNFYLRQFELTPGGHTPFHGHDWEHEVYVLEGEGRINFSDNKSETISKGSFILVMPGEEHQFENTGASVFRFLCIIPKYGE